MQATQAPGTQGLRGPGEVGEGRRTQVSLSGPHCLWGECVLSSEAGERVLEALPTASLWLGKKGEGEG